MKKLMTCSALFLFASQAMAALPPYYQTAREIVAIAESEKVAGLLSPYAPIDNIYRHKEGYTVMSGNCSVEVRIIYEKDGPVGPGNFSVKAESVSCAD
jgi:hypothetical protein